jgi:hypothetical protein
MVVAATGARAAPATTPPRRYLRKLKDSMEQQQSGTQAGRHTHLAGGFL